MAATQLEIVRDPPPSDILFLTFKPYFYELKTFPTSQPPNLLLLLLLVFQNLTPGSSQQLEYRYEYSHTTDTRYIKGAQDTSRWCITDYVSTLPTHKEERQVTSVFADNNFMVENYEIEDSQRPEWASPIEKTVLDHTGLKALRPNGNVALFMPMSLLDSSYFHIRDSIAAGHTVGKLPLFPQTREFDTDSLQAAGYLIEQQPNRDLWFWNDNLFVKIMPSVLTVEVFKPVWDGETQHYRIQHYRVDDQGDTVLQKTISRDNLVLCSGACIARETREVYFGYSFFQPGGQPKPLSSADAPNSSAISLHAYPNPVEDKLFLKFNHVPAAYLVRVYDFQGRVVRESRHETSQVAIDIGDLPSGAYALAALFPGQNILQTIVKL